MVLRIDIFFIYLFCLPILIDTIMTCMVNSQSCLHPDTIFLVFDVEAIGPVKYPVNCKIWNFAAVNLTSKDEIDLYIDPQDAPYDPPPHTDLFHLTSDFIQQKKAQPFSHAGPQIIQWIQSQTSYPTQNVVLISHGNHMLDKPLLEAEFGRLKMVLPCNWYFFDTLSWFRAVIKKAGSYSLKKLYEQVFNQSIRNQHFALSDTKALVSLLEYTLQSNHLTPVFLSTKLFGIYYPPYFTPLQKIKYCGNYNESLLVNGGIQCVEDLSLLLLQRCRLNVGLMQSLLMNTYHIKMDSALKISNSILSMLLCPK